MILQKLVWDTTGEYGNLEMFFRGKALELYKEVGDGSLTIPDGERISFDTYFNIFSFKKWKHYTYVSAVSISVTLKGVGTAFLIGIEESKINGMQKEYVLDSVYFNSDENMRIKLRMENVDYKKHEEISYCYLKIEALGETQISDGAYECHEECEELGKKRPVKIACCICTYHREEFVRRNVSLMSECLLSSASAMADSFEIFVVDNGKTLKKEMLVGEYEGKIHLIPNTNYGGSAGFTRGMLEAAIYRKNKDFTHVILMDDDIQIYPEVLIRTKTFLQMLSKEYQDNILGGAMLLLEQKNIQAEACGYYDIMSGRNRIDTRNGMDLTLRENIIRNEAETDVNFSGWWYSCIPVSMIQDGNLPLPLFIHRDDQDYGVRSKKEILQLNGICIWHPSPSGKHADNINYYDMRNMLITIMDICPMELTKKYLKHYLVSESIKKMLGYRYRGADMMLDGCEAFLNGPEEFLKSNPEKLHGELLQKCKVNWLNLEKESIREVKKLSEERHLPIWIKIVCYLKPDNRTCYVEAGCNYPSYLGYKRVIYMDEGMQRGFQLERSLAETKKLLFRLICICKMVDKRFEKAVQEWIREIPNLKTVFFWEKYLKISNHPQGD